MNIRKQAIALAQGQFERIEQDYYRARSARNGSVRQHLLDALEDARIEASDELEVPMEWGWDCPDPRGIGHCAYDLEVDPCMDSCLFCGDTYEKEVTWTLV